MITFLLSVAAILTAAIIVALWKKHNPLVEKTLEKGWPGGLLGAVFGVLSAGCFFLYFYEDLRGEAGLSVLHGMTTPTAELGRDGEFYMDTSQYTLYGPKSGGEWGEGIPMHGGTGTTGLPEGFVVAFAGLECPPGWQGFEPAADRFIVGASATREVTLAPNGLVFPTDGNETVTLELHHLPDHTVELGDHVMLHGRFHSSGVPQQDHYIVMPGSDFDNETIFVRAERLSQDERGANFTVATFTNTSPIELRALNILPPYIALNFCTPES